MYKARRFNARILMQALVLAFFITASQAVPTAAQNTAMPPAEPAKDVQSALYKAADALGMLRGPEERDGILTFEYWATGTLEGGGTPCQIKEYRASVRYPAADRRETAITPVPAMRVDFTCTGDPQRQVQVVAGDYACEYARLLGKARDHTVSP